MTSLPPCALRSKDVRPPLVALPTRCDCSLLVSDIEPRADELLVEDDPLICLATLAFELLADEDGSLTEDELLEDDELLTEEDLEDLLDDELLAEEPALLRLSS